MGSQLRGLVEVVAIVGAGADNELKSKLTDPYCRVGSGALQL